MAPLPAPAMQALRAMGIVSINYSTDDPWNPAQRARWFLRALPYYDHVFTPRSANVEDFERLGCRDVRRLPFGYDDSLFRPSAATPATPVSNVLFVGGADPDRVAFMTAYMRSGPAPALAGVYWDRHPAMRSHAIGVKSPEELSRLTAAAKVNLCLVRRANRDGHVMRSFEIAAIGGCMLAEHTDEHRQIFGEDGEAVAYFDSPESAARRARDLIADPAERRRLALAVRQRMAEGGHTYRDRLATMIAAAGGTLAAGRQAPRGTG
jgi:spore maturation protein CgeB